MGFMKNMFATLEKEVEKALNEQVGNSTGSSSKSKKEKRHSGGPATRWEKAVVSLDKIVGQVAKIDPDGVDIVCFGGEGEAQWYKNIKDTKNIEEMVNDKRPRGKCYMGSAMEECLEYAFEKELAKRPVAILVLTAGKPSDAEVLDASLLKAVQRLAENCEKCPLSVTFVQIGHDEDATDYLQHLDNHIQAESAKSGEMFDLVDTIKDAEIQQSMKEIKGTQSSGKNGALIGALAGAAMGMGGLYLYNKQQAKKRTKGWNGKWKCTYGGEEICILDVKDDMTGNLVIEGFPAGEPTTGTYTVAEDDDDDDEYAIQFVDPAGDWEIEGTVEDEHAITWSDGTRWDEIPPSDAGWGAMAGAAAAGAAAAGTTGYLLDKKFFNKVSKADQCDYIILMDRSSKMAVVEYDDDE